MPALSIATHPADSRAAGAGEAVPVPVDSPNYGISDHDLPLSSDDDECFVPLPFIGGQVPTQPPPSQVGHPKALNVAAPVACHAYNTSLFAAVLALSGLLIVQTCKRSVCATPSQNGVCPTKDRADLADPAASRRAEYEVPNGSAPGAG